MNFNHQEHDFRLISGDFLYDELPQDKEYLVKYFPVVKQRNPNGDIQYRFLVYWFHFRDLITYRQTKFFCDSFVDHTGEACTFQWIYILMDRLNVLEDAYNKARNEMDLELLSKIKSGNFNID